MSPRVAPCRPVPWVGPGVGEPSSAAGEAGGADVAPLRQTLKPLVGVVEENPVVVLLRQFTAHFRVHDCRRCDTQG